MLPASRFATDQATVPRMGEAESVFTGWAAAQAYEIGQRVAQRRKDLGLSAPDLAGRCEALGMPSFTRQVIMRLEHGRREAVSVAELAVLAAALEIAPLLLLYPVGQADETEYLPGHRAAPWDAARWWSGEISVSAKGDMYRGERRLPAELFRDHHQVLQEVPGYLTRGAYLRARREEARPGSMPTEDREAMFAVIALREIRASIRDTGLVPPRLPAELAWIDELES